MATDPKKFQEDEFCFPDQEDFDPEPPEPEGPLSRLPSAKHFKPAIFCFVLFYAASVIYSKHPIGNLLWASGEAIFSDHEYWRLITSVFTHSNMLHLLSNTMIFLLFGWLLRAYFGFLIFPVVSLVLGIITTFFTITIYDPQIRLIGASGMNYGMVAMWLVFYLYYDTDNNFAIKILRAVGFIMAVMLPTSISPQTSYLAHASGFGIGIIFGLFLLPLVKIRNPE